MGRVLGIEEKFGLKCLLMASNLTKVSSEKVVDCGLYKYDLHLDLLTFYVQTTFTLINKRDQTMLKVDT